MATRKKRYKRYIKCSTYSTEPQGDLRMTLLETRDKYLTRYKYVAIGLTSTPQETYKNLQDRASIAWSQMKLVFRVDDPRKAEDLHKSLIQIDWYHTDESWEFPKDLFNERKSCYAYVVLGKRKRVMKKRQYKFIDLFAGIGGFHQAFHAVGGKCVFASEWDKYARISYEANYNEIEPELFEKDENNRYKYFNEDINDANPQDIPDFDICCGGFPCQAFSIAGLKRGFEDTRGTLFFNIANIVKYKKEHGHAPKVLLLENVKGLKMHDKGNTLKVILGTLDELNYGYRVEVLNAKYFGVPQNRERLFIVAWDKDSMPDADFRFPYGIDAKGQTIFDKDDVKNNCIETHVRDIFEPRESLDNPDDSNTNVTISDRMWIGHQERKKRNRENGKGFGYSLFMPDSTYCSTISARYWKDGSEILIDQTQYGMNPRKLTPVEAGRLQGYNVAGHGWEQSNTSCTSHEQIPFKIVVSKKEAYHQFGNSVAVPVIKRLAQEIVKQLL